MHLTPEQIDRQPFKMSRRAGYDIVQVRDFLREIAAEMRERQLVREHLAQTGDGDAVGEATAKRVIADAEARAAAIIAEAEASAAETAAMSAETAAITNADKKAAEIVAAAEREAESMIDIAETRAEARSAAVLAEAQVRLDQLLVKERDLRRRIDKQPDADGIAIQGVDRSRNGVRTSVDARDRTPVAESEYAFANFMKTTLRDEVHPD